MTQNDTFSELMIHGGITFTDTIDVQQPEPTPAPRTQPASEPTSTRGGCLPPVAPPPPVVPPPVVPIPPPPAFAKTTHPMAIPPTLKTAFPYATNSWWQNIILGKNRIAPEPYQLQVVDNGFLVCYPAQSLTLDSAGMQHITTQFLQDMTLEFKENMGHWAVTAYDDLTVTLTWVSATRQAARSVIAQGCPFLTMAYAGTTPLVTTQHAIMSVNGSTMQGPYTGSKFKVMLNNGQTWLLYSSNSLTFTWNGGQLIATAPFSSIVRLAILANATDEAILDQYVPAIPTAGVVSAAYTSTAATYTFHWTVTGTGPLLMCALPHHMDILQAPQTVALTRTSINGAMIGVLGNAWNLVEPLPAIQWTASKPIDPAQKAAIAAQLQKDATTTYSGTADTYEGGKEVAKLARLVLIADEIEDTASATTIRTNLKAAINPWLEGTSANQLMYDTTWGGILSAEGLADKGAQYGSGYYNDLHFHFGYWVFAAAVIAKGDSAWLTTYQERVTELLHTYCNPDATDTRFPVRRYKDMYAGHSWASGLFDFADNRNQESTSEAVNAYGAMYLWGLVTNDAATANHGALMFASEIRSARRYWHVYANNNVYGSTYTDKGVGICWSTKIDDSTWFASQLSCRRGIQVIPITQFSELLLEADWIKTMVSSGEMVKMQAENFGIWPTFVNAMLAVVDPSTAWTNFTAMADNQIDPGASRTNLLWWSATR